MGGVRWASWRWAWGGDALGCRASVVGGGAWLVGGGAHCTVGVAPVGWEGRMVGIEVGALGVTPVADARTAAQGDASGLDAFFTRDGIVEAEEGLVGPDAVALVGALWALGTSQWVPLVWGRHARGLGGGGTVGIGRWGVAGRHSRRAAVGVG
jgi:hypothetical protein